jgi:hypothetical protein
MRFLEAVGQFERIVNDSGLVGLTRLTGDEITGISFSWIPEIALPIFLKFKYPS